MAPIEEVTACGMAPIEEAKAVLSPKSAATDQTKKADAADRQEKPRELHSESLPRMTPELLQNICKERQMWAQAHLNTQLFLNYKGFLRIESLEDFINVRALHLDNNNILKIEGLNRMTDLRSLNLGGNRISVIENLESNIELRQLNLEGNAIRHVEDVRHLTKLETLNLSANHMESLQGLSNLKELPALINLDLSQNSVEDEEGVVEFWSEFKNLKVLRFHGNPGVRNISHYRKNIINALPNLSYMDERPIFPVERKACTAWAEGGLTAMHEATREYHKARHAQSGVDPERRELVTKRRQMAIERLDREAKEREEKEEKQRVEAAKKTPDSGDLEALKEYKESWKSKVDKYGTDGLREQVAKEMGGAQSMGGGENNWSSASARTMPAANAQREYSADFDFAPPSRQAAPASLLATPSAASATGRGARQDRPVDAAAFRQGSSGQELDNCDRQFSVLTDDVDCSLHAAGAAPSAAPSHAPSAAPAAAKGRADTLQAAAARRAATIKAAANETTMPLIWERRQAEVLAAEADCLARQSAAEAESSGPAAFRRNDLEGLD